MNPYLTKLRALSPEKRHAPSKPIQTVERTFFDSDGLGFEGFEGTPHGAFSENGLDLTQHEPSKSASIRYPENPQNLPSGMLGDSEVRGFQKAYAVLAMLEARCPDRVEIHRWRQVVTDGRQFLVKWGAQAEALGWTADDLFGLFAVPAHAEPSFQRLSRYDEMGLVWLLQGRSVTALTTFTAAIRNPTNAVSMYYRKGNNKLDFPPERLRHYFLP